MTRRKKYLRSHQRNLDPPFNVPLLSVPYFPSLHITFTHLPAQIEDDPTPEATPEHTPEPTPEPKSDLYIFLKGLEHDLSGFTDALTKQQLGTTEKLFAIAGWPEERLHRVLIESIPDLPVPQRFMLVLGMKKAAGLVGSD
ncbi:hypothetical protein FPV67DRAFT_1203315 [Lyophyllum atratum]|nr:hypothetical protein FPV67DRAFT_1203315 [Lyophyllum atratum]